MQELEFEIGGTLMFNFDWYYYALFGFAIAWPIIAKVVFGRTISKWEMLINIVVVVTVIFGLLQFGRSMEMSDTEIWNGEITGKERVRVSCSHSYDCFCTYDSDGNAHCMTCYEHNHDWNYEVYSNIGSFRIDRIDSQGIKTPERWSDIEIGEPASRLNTYVNYIKGIGRSHFAVEDLTNEYAHMLPAYPDAVYDYYHVDRVLSADVAVPEIAVWNENVSEILRTIGPEKQTNLVIVFANTDNPGYKYALQQHWLGGKKNDVVVVFGTPKFPSISWVGVFALSENKLFAKGLENDLLSLKTIKRTDVLSTIQNQIIQNHERLPMETFRELESEVRPPLWSVIVAGLFCIFGSIGLSLFFHRHEVV